MLTMMREGFFAEGLHYDFYLFFEKFAVGIVVGICAGYAERVDLARMVAASYAEYDAPFGEYICSGVVFGQPQWMPHWIDVKTTAKLQVLS